MTDQQAAAKAYAEAVGGLPPGWTIESIRGASDNFGWSVMPGPAWASTSDSALQRPRGESVSERAYPWAIAIRDASIDAAKPLTLAEVLVVEQRAKRIIGLMQRSPGLGLWAVETILGRDGGVSLDRAIEGATLLLAFLGVGTPAAGAEAPAASKGAEG